jgi:hypothetical protein
MHVSEIVLGRSYFGRAGAVRKIVAERRPELSLPEELDYVRWRLVRRGVRNTAAIGNEGICSRKAFARWATRIVDEPTTMLA